MTTICQRTIILSLHFLTGSKMNQYWQGNHRQGELIGMQAFAPEEISQNYFKRLEEQMKYDEMLLAA